MSDKDSAVFGIYSTHAALEAAVDALRAKGFRSTDISVLSAQNPGFTDFTSGKDATHEAPAGHGPAEAVGTTLGWLAGMSALAMAGGVFIVAGPIMAALARMGEAAGNIAGALAGFGVPDVAAKQYEGRIFSGGMLLSVHTDDSKWFNQGKHILEETGAEVITSTGAQVSEPLHPDIVAEVDRLLTLDAVPEPLAPDALAKVDRLLHEAAYAKP